jgi:hypothetical protein
VKGLRAGAVGVGIALALTACGGGKAALKSDPVPVGGPGLQAVQACNREVIARQIGHTPGVAESHPSDGGWVVDGVYLHPDGTLGRYTCRYPAVGTLTLAVLS